MRYTGTGLQTRVIDESKYLDDELVYNRYLDDEYMDEDLDEDMDEGFDEDMDEGLDEDMNEGYVHIQGDLLGGYGAYGKSKKKHNYKKSFGRRR